MTAPDVLQPSSPEEAVSLFEAGVTVIGGGTIVVPDLTSGRLRPERAMLLTGAGLAGITRDGSRVTIGATTPVSELESLSAPIGPCAANVADSEIRAQGTVGGNLCAGEGPEAPRGDLQGAFLAVGATVRSAGAGGETTEALEDFLRRGVRFVRSELFHDSHTLGRELETGRTHAGEHLLYPFGQFRSFH